MTHLDPRREQYAGAITEHLWGSPEGVDEATSGVMELADQEARELRRQVDIADSVTAETKRLLERRTSNLRARAEAAEADRDRFEAAWQSARQRAAEQRTIARVRQERLRIRARRIIELEQRAAQAEAALARVQHVAALIHAGAPWTASRTDTAARIRAAITGPGTAATEATGATAHRYLSTGCLHGEHSYCSNVDGIVGLKKPAQCKFCQAPCICPCHQTTEA